MARRVFPHGDLADIERMVEGVSTWVYRVHRGRETFYLRVLPEEGASFAPEAHAHTLLRQRGVRVPEVIYLAPSDDALGRSVMVTTAIPGVPVSALPIGRALREALAEGGRDLAAINAVPVEGFGWIDRGPDTGSALRGEQPAALPFVLEGLDDDLALLARHALTVAEAARAGELLFGFDAWIGAERAWLAHGDFDLTHIYQERGRYTGIIDFGEIRGTPPLYDLGHFLLRDGERLPGQVLPHLLAGYGEAMPLPADHARQIGLACLHIAVRALARGLRRMPPRLPSAHELSVLRRESAPEW